MSTNAPMFGLDYLGGAKYQKLIVREHPQGWAAGFFWNIDGFGSAKNAIVALCKTKRCPLIRVHLMWRDKHDFKREDLKTIKERAKRLKQVIQQFPDVNWFVSPACEHELGAEVAIEFARAVRSILGDLATIVNTPHGKGSFIYENQTGFRVVNEFHHTNPKPPKGDYAFSFDGKNCVDSDVTKYKSQHLANAEYFMLWNCQMNGLPKLPKEGEKKIPRNKRVAWPTARELDSFVYLSRDRGTTKPPKGWVLKSHADRHETPPAEREGEPVYISAQKVGNQIELVCDNGQVVAVGKYRGIFNGGGFMYQFLDFGYLIAEKAKRIQGSPVVKIRANGKIVGTVNPAFRDGTFR